MAFSIEIAIALPLYPNGVLLQWSLRDALESGVYLATIYRSGSPVGPWETLTETQPNLWLYRDSFPAISVEAEPPSQLSLSRGIYYRIRVTPPSGAAGTVEIFSAVEPQLTGRQRLLKRKILRDEAVMLSRLNGVPAAVLKRRHWGERCPKCYDRYTRESMRGSCSSCFGTTFVAGYFDPVMTWAKRAPAPVQTVVTPEGKADVALTGVTLLAAPAVQEEDLLVFAQDDRRFLVRQVQPTELRTVTVHQRISVSELARSDIAYRVPVDLAVAPRFL